MKGLTEHIESVTNGLRQLPLLALKRAKQRCEDDPEHILLDGKIKNQCRCY
jgi:hypothetical protein